MKEIIKHGKFYNEKMIITCPFCQCEFKYQLEDIYKERIAVLTAPTEKSFVICPECNVEIDIGTSTIITTYPYPQSPYGGPIITYMNANEKYSCKKEGECSCIK